MKRLLITGGGPQHIYVANKLAEEAGLNAIIVDRGLRQTGVERTFKLLRRYNSRQFADRLLRRAAYTVWSDEAERKHQLLRILGPDSKDFRFRSLLHEVEGVNTLTGRALVEELNPDQILIFGTTIVRDHILQLSRDPPLNMHTGISPHYRGSSCSFWPVHDGRFDMLGATVHECVATLDGGAIYAVDRAQLYPDDTIHTIFARCVLVGARLYVDVLNRFDRFACAAKQQDLTIGKEYRATDRTLAAELRARRRLKSGELRRFIESGTLGWLDAAG